MTGRLTPERVADNAVCGTCLGEREVCYDPDHSSDPEHECDPEECEDCDGSGAPVAELWAEARALRAEIARVTSERDETVEALAKVPRPCCGEYETGSGQHTGDCAVYIAARLDGWRAATEAAALACEARPATACCASTRLLIARDIRALARKEPPR